MWRKFLCNACDRANQEKVNCNIITRLQKKHMHIKNLMKRGFEVIFEMKCWKAQPWVFWTISGSMIQALVHNAFFFFFFLCRILYKFCLSTWQLQRIEFGKLPSVFFALVYLGLIFCYGQKNLTYDKLEIFIFLVKLS